jgi:cobalamin synthase
MSAPARNLLRDAWGQVGRVTIVPEGDSAQAPWPAALVIATGIAVGAAAWLAGRLVGAIGVAPALWALVSTVVVVVLGAAVVERGLHASSERWLGARWASLVVGGSVLGKVVALWSIAPRFWPGALVLSVAAGRWAAVGLQRLGDVAAPGRGRTFVIGAFSWLELAVASVVIAALFVLVGGAAGLAIALAAVVVAVALGLGVQILDRELAGDSLAAVAAVIELVVLIGMAAAEPAALSPFVR